MKGSCANTAGNGGRVEVVTNHTPSRPGHDVKLSTQSGGEVFCVFIPASPLFPIKKWDTFWFYGEGYLAAQTLKEIKRIKRNQQTVAPKRLVSVAVFE